MWGRNLVATAGNLSIRKSLWVSCSQPGQGQSNHQLWPFALLPWWSLLCVQLPGCVSLLLPFLPLASARGCLHKAAHLHPPQPLSHFHFVLRQESLLHSFRSQTFLKGHLYNGVHYPLMGYINPLLPPDLQHCIEVSSPTGLLGSMATPQHS